MTTMPPELGDSRKTQEMLWKQIKEQGHLPGFSNVVDPMRQRRVRQYGAGHAELALVLALHGQ